MDTGTNGDTLFQVNRRARCKVRDSFGFDVRQRRGEYDEKQFIFENQRVFSSELCHM